LEFKFEILQIYLTTPSASNCWVKMWLCWKKTKLQTFLTWPPTDFSAFKNVSQPVLCAARRCALCMLTRRPAGRWIRWAAGDCFKRTII